MLLVAEPILGEEEKLALSDVVDSGWINMGDQVRAFERAFAERHGAADAVAVSSCTAALHLILEALGIGPGDEVLVPSLTFVATVNSVLCAGATPVFVDIEALDIPLMSRADAISKCTPKTKAVIIMHYAGYLADREEWRDFARTYGLLLIEDAAHAVGVAQAGTFGDAAAFSFYGNNNMTSLLLIEDAAHAVGVARAGSPGDAAAFSFYSNNNMTTAEGGVVIASNEEVLAKIRQMRGHGMTSGTFQRRSSRTVTYDVTMLGYNYRMDELRAVIGLAQLRSLGLWNEKRKVLTRAYRQWLSDLCPDLCVPFAQPRISAHHIMPVVLPIDVDRQRVVDEMRIAEVRSTVHYPPAHQLSFYRSRYPFVHLPRTEEFARRELTLPLHPKMDESQVGKVAAALARALDH